MHSVAHLSGIGHFGLFFSLQLHFLLLVLLFICMIFWLWLFMILPMFFIQLYPIFTVLRLNSLCRGLFMGKCLSMSFKNSFPRCVFSDILYGGVYQITSLVLFLLLDLLGSVVLSYFSLVAYPLVVSAFSYSTLFSLNIFSDEERSLSLLFTALGKFSFTWRGWFEYLFIYI